MPIRKPRLNREEEARNLERLKQLRAEGIDVEIPEEKSDRDRALDIIVASPAESTVYESPTGGINYAPRVRLVARSGLILNDCDIITKHDNQIVLESFTDPICKLGGIEYLPGEVLNHRIELGLRLSRGEMAEGVILATGLWRIPPQYREFAVPFEIMFADQFGHEFRADGMFSVSRQVQRDTPKVRRGTSLNDVDATGKPAELSVSEEARRRYIELVAQEKRVQNDRVATIGS